MSSFGRRIVQTWVGYGPRFLPFADAATPDLPLSRLLRLSLFQVSVGMALVLLVGTLNRVMIVELSVPASLVGSHRSTGTSTSSTPRPQISRPATCNAFRPSRPSDHPA